MAHRKYSSKQRKARERPSRAVLKALLVLLVVSAILAIRLVILRWQTSESARAPDQQGAPSFYASAEAGKPFPATLSPAAFQDPTVAHAYEIAKKSPGLMVQLPCYCWCSRDLGHRSLLDCYTSVHAASCDICIKEALLAETMSRAGRRTDEIRAAIIARDWTTAH